MGIKLSKVAKTAKKYDHILIIMRHAKAEPFGNKGDSERELTDKGLKQAKAVGKGIESLGLVPDQISCSSATRTRQTLDLSLIHIFLAGQIPPWNRINHENLASRQVGNYPLSSALAWLIRLWRAACAASNPLCHVSNEPEPLEHMLSLIHI